MLKKIIATICLITLLSVFMSGCIAKNEQRDADQAIAVVRYGGRVAYVTKGELANLYNQQGYMYIYYYGWTADKTFEQLSKSLANSALLGLKAKEYLASLPEITVTNSTVGIEKPTVEQMILEMEQMLSDKELMEAKEAANKVFRDAYDSLVKEIEEEIRLANPIEDEEEEEEEEEEVEETDTPRPQPPKDEEEINVVIPDDFFTIMARDLTSADTIGKEAIRRLKKSLAKQHKDYNYYYNNQLSSKIIDKYKEEYKKSITEPTEADIEARYNEMLARNIQSFAVEGAYAKALEANPKDVIFHPGYDRTASTGYFYVKNILIKFSEDQSNALTSYKNEKVANEAAIKAYRQTLSTLITVKVSNINYDAEGDKDDPNNQMYTRVDVPVQTILNEIETDLNAAVTLEDKIKVFIDWTYLVNDDPGMFTNLSEGKPDYLVAPAGMTSNYVPEFTELARGLFALGEGAYGLNNNQLSFTVTDYGIHLILVTAIPFNYAEKQGKDGIAILDDKNVLTLDAVIDNTTGETLREYIVDTLKEERATNAMTVINNAFFEAHKDTAIIAYPKVYKDLLKEAQKLEKE